VSGPVLLGRCLDQAGPLVQRHDRGGDLEQPAVIAVTAADSSREEMSWASSVAGLAHRSIRSSHHG
jgi:hypothetical protein